MFDLQEREFTPVSRDYKEDKFGYIAEFKNYTDDQVIASFNNQVGNPGWVGQRGYCLAALSWELQRRFIDSIAIVNITTEEGGLKIDKKIKLNRRKREIEFVRKNTVVEKLRELKNEFLKVIIEPVRIICFSIIISPAFLIILGIIYLLCNFNINLGRNNFPNGLLFSMCWYLINGLFFFIVILCIILLCTLLINIILELIPYRLLKFLGLKNYIKTFDNLSASQSILGKTIKFLNKIITIIAMKKEKIDSIFKLGILILIVCFLIILKDISNNMKIGRFQYDNSGGMFIDTKTGKIYAIQSKGKPIELSDGVVKGEK